MLREFGPLQEDVIVHFTRQILLGLRYLHKKHIVHRDIKGATPHRIVSLRPDTPLWRQTSTCGTGVAYWVALSACFPSCAQRR